MYSSRGTPNIGTAPASVRASTSPSDTTACPRVTRQERPCRPASPRLPCAKHSFAVRGQSWKRERVTLGNMLLKENLVGRILGKIKIFVQHFVTIKTGVGGFKHLKSPAY